MTQDSEPGHGFAKNPVFIREAQLSDAAAIAGLISQLGYPTSPEEMAARLGPILDDPTYLTIVAEAPQGVIGLIGARLGHALEFDNQFATLTALVIDENWRTKGIGTLLLARVERWARGQGAIRTVLTSSPHRTDAHRFYLGLGYQQTGLRFAKRLEDQPSPGERPGSGNLPFDAEEE